MKILVLNSGSSSLKFKIFSRTGLEAIAEGIVEEIGRPGASFRFTALGGKIHTKGEVNIHNHFEAIRVMSSLMKSGNIVHNLEELFGIGHRVVHGGESFTKAVLIDQRVIGAIEDLIPLAPLHNPSNLLGIKVAMEHAPAVPQVAVFDTAFHQGMPSHSFLYAIPKILYTRQKIRRYGFHGTSYSFVTRRAAQFMGRDTTDLSCICLHLGNGASIAAVKKGRCVDTSMGLTPLEGLVMGTRSGDIDPAIIFFLHRNLHMDIDEIDSLLNRDSGLMGLCGDSDMRTIEARIMSGDRDAETALELFSYRAKKYVGAYTAAIGGPDCIIFTGGIGEHSSLVRERICSGLECMGIKIDSMLNRSIPPDNADVKNIEVPDSAVKVLVVPTDEELEIARQTLHVLKK